MTTKEFLQKIIEACPSRGLDNVDIYINSEVHKDETADGYKIINISNEGSNDGIFITIRKI